MEVLVVFVILLILAGFLLMFLQRLRETANQAHCANNLKTIGEAIYQGESPERIVEKNLPGPPLPAARIADGYATWAVQLAPVLDQTSSLKDWDLRRSYIEQPAPVREAALAWFFCPARNRPQPLSSEGDVPAQGAENIPGALGDYACASGDGDPKQPWDSDQANGAIIPGKVLERKGDLILRWRSRSQLAMLKRGLSNTILIGEKHVPPEGFGKAAFGDGALYNGANPASFARAGGPGFGLAQAPTSPFNNNFGSYHAGICQFLMADNSVRPIAIQISENVLGQLIRRE